MRGDKKSERSQVDYWVREINSHIKRTKPEIDRYLRFVRWYRGDLREMNDPEATTGLDYAWQSSLDNMHTFVTDAAIAQIMFRAPRFEVRCAEGKSRGIFTPALARVETAMLNDTIEQIGYFRTARRTLLDARNGPYGVKKISFECDMVVDDELIAAARAEAQEENKNFIAFGKKMEAREDQIHSLHIDEHRVLLALSERGEIELPKPAIKYLKKHIALHEAMRTSERPTETARDASIVCRRISPLDFFYDVTVDDIRDARWYCHSYLMRRAEAMANERFDKDARDQLEQTTDRWERFGVTSHQRIPTTGSFDNSDALVRCNEVFDRVEGRILEFFDSGTVMASERDWTFKTVQRSGPYSILMFKPDPLEAAGISPPIGWEAEQHAATRLQSANVAAAIEASRARGVYDKQSISTEEVTRIMHAPTGEWIGVNIPGDKKGISDVIGPAPDVEIKEQSLVVRQLSLSRIMQSSGLGQQRALAGDKSGSATEAALTAGAADAISEDMAAILDEVSSYDGKMILRLTRKCVPKARVVETVGADAELVYPEMWADRDIENDRSCYVIPGSSRRRSTDVQTKVQADLLMATAELPFMQSPSGQSLMIQSLRRIFDDMGLSGLDWDAVDAEQKAMAMLAQQMAAGGGAPPEEGGGPPAQRPSEMTEPSEAGMHQGMQNVGGGRFPTGASMNDNPRVLRGGAGRNV